MSSPFGTSSGTTNLINGANTFYQTDQAPEILENFLCETFVDKVTSGRRLQGVLDNNKLSYTYSRVSRPEVHDLILGNAEYATPEMPTITECTIRLGYGKYTSIKLDDEQLNRMYDKGSTYKSELAKSSAEELAQKHQYDFMCWLAGQVHACNQGDKAGKQSGSLNLGTPSNPFVMNPVNIMALGTMLNQSLDEHNLPHGERAMIVPSVVASQMRMSVAGSMANIGAGMKQYMAGQCADLALYAPCGQDIYQYTCLNGRVNANNQVIFPVYYIWKPALDTAYGMDKTNSGIWSSDQSRGPLYHTMRTIIRYGFSSVYCQGVARAWVTLDKDWMKKLPGAGCTV